MHRPTSSDEQVHPGRETLIASQVIPRRERAGNVRVAGGVETRIVAGVVALQVYGSLVVRTRRPLRALRVLRALAHKQRLAVATPGGPKLVRCGRRYYRDVYMPGWPSPAFRIHVGNECRRAEGTAPAPPVSMVILKITRRCPLHCEHCVDGELHDGATDPSRATLLRTVRTIRSQGVAQLQLTGGEPLTRLADLLELIRSTEGRMDVRLQTSGVGLTADVARRLKEAGLAGIHLSLDHWDPRKHDAFRGGTHVYRWVARAARHAREAGLLVVLSLCATRDFVTRANLIRYAAAARELGALFIQILEPKAVGCYAGRDVTLPRDQTDLLEWFMASMNGSARRANKPIVVYLDARERQFGCQGAGNRYVYIDECRRVYACPFSETAAGSLADDAPIGELAGRLRGRRCAACPSTPHPPGRVIQGAVQHEIECGMGQDRGPDAVRGFPQGPQQDPCQEGGYGQEAEVCRGHFGPPGEEQALVGGMSRRGERHGGDPAIPSQARLDEAAVDEFLDAADGRGHDRKPAQGGRRRG